jgi:DNA (cytosine-5)-methyltransferase 1
MEKSIVDLFCGTGAFTLAFSKYNCFKSVFANDMIEDSQKIYNLNHPEVSYTLGDLNNIDVKKIPQHNILCGGFPCQPFSIAGKQQGFADTRSNVFWKIVKILEYHQPEIVVLENVKNLVSHDKGETFKIIKEKLTGLGYYIKHKILDTSLLTKIPHHRERIYIVCFKEKVLYDKFNFDFPEVENDRVITYLETDIPDKYYYTDKLKVFTKVKESVTKHINSDVLYQYRRHYIRENKSKQCPTLTANMGSGGHNVPLLLDDKGIRKLTPRECFNLQGFPASYVLPNISNSRLYKLAGNAVSVPIVELIVDKIYSILQ